MAGFTSIGELIDLVDEWSGADDGTNGDRVVRVLLGSEPFATSRRSFASAHARFTEDVRRYWLEERGISLDLSAAVVTAIEAIDAGRLEAHAVIGDRPLHAKILIGDHAATVGSSNFTGAGLVTNLEVNARFADDTDPVRFEDLVRTGRALWEVGSDWTAELRSLLEALLRVAPWERPPRRERRSAAGAARGHGRSRHPHRDRRADRAGGVAVVGASCLTSVSVSDPIPEGYARTVDAARTLRQARRSAGLTLRDLAVRSETSHATLAAYESGRVTPRVDTLDRVLRAAGYEAAISLRRRPDATPAEREAKGRELVEVLDLASRFPARHARNPRHPRFPPAPAA